MILVLDSEADEELTGRLVEELERAGGEPQISRGEEAIVIALGCCLSPEQVRGILERYPQVDPVPILSGVGYRAEATRRRFLNGFVAALGILTAAGVTLPVAGFLLPPSKNGWSPSGTRAGLLDRFPENSARKIRVHGHPVLLIRLQGRSFYALSATCTHMNICEVEWSPERQQLVCPCHGGIFDLNGNVVEGPPRIPLARYTVKVEGEEVHLQSPS